MQKLKFRCDIDQCLISESYPKLDHTYVLYFLYHSTYLNVRNLIIRESYCCKKY